MAINMPCNKRWFILSSIILIIIFFYFLITTGTSKLNPKFVTWKSLRMSRKFTQKWTERVCLGRNVSFNIKNLAEIIDQWKLASNPECLSVYKQFSNIYSIEKNSAPLKLSEPLKVKVKIWLKNDEDLFKEVYTQEVTQIYNEWTRENTIFNPLREKRPIMKPKEPEKEYKVQYVRNSTTSYFSLILKDVTIPGKVTQCNYVKKLVEESVKSCDFCNYKKYTAEDTFGRLESQYAYSASNIFKLDKFHGLFAMKTHHPHDWNLLQYMDMMNLTQKWFEMTRQADPNFCCPEIVWDILPKAGASQIHPHMHGLMGKKRYHGEAEKMRRASLDYLHSKGSNYFKDLIDVHSALGLAVQHKDAIAIASLTPKKDHEIMIIASEPTKAFFEMIYLVLRAFIDDLEKLATSLGIALPPMDNSKPMPAFARIVTRGAIASVRSDISSLELFSATNVNIDPFKVIQVIKASVDKRVV